MSAQTQAICPSQIDPGTKGRKRCAEVRANTRPAVRQALGQLLDAHLPVLFTGAVDRPSSRLPDLLDLALPHSPQPEAAVALVSQLPERSTGLATLAATLTSQQVTQYRAGARGGEPDAADRLPSSQNGLSVRLGDLGRREETLAASAEATGIYREPTARWLDVYHHELEQSLQIAS
jgi:hypothetical protein